MRCQSDPCPSVQEETSPAEWMSGSSQFTLLDSLHTHIITLLKLPPQLFLLLPRDRPRQRARNLLSFKKQVVAVLPAADQYLTLAAREIKFLLYILSSSFPQRDAAAQPDHVINTMPEMANLVYNMYMHMIQTSQKHRQVSKLQHLHTLRRNDFFLICHLTQSLTHKSQLFLILTSKSRAWLHRRTKPSPMPQPRPQRPALRIRRKKPQWNRSPQKKSQSLRAPARPKEKKKTT